MYSERKVSSRDPMGTKSRYRNGHIYVKTKEHGMIKEARYIIMLKEGRALDKNERVFFRDGNRENVSYDNLAPIHFAEARFRFLPRSRVIYVPKAKRTVFA